MANIVVLTGAGMSAESGIRTFRDNNGLWENHDIYEVASPEGFAKNPELVMRFYNDRRRQLKDVQPNAAHYALVDLEKNHNVQIITQNVDDLHERAGSTHVMHLHGELRKVRSTADPSIVLHWEEDLNFGDLCSKGSQLRPHIVWFGEDVPMIGPAAAITAEAEIVIIIGTSMAVYPAAGLVNYAPPYAPVYYIDPKADDYHGLPRPGKLHLYSTTATKGMEKLLEELG